MGRPLFSWWLVAALGCGLMSGCGPARRPYLDDPFLASKHPVEGKPAAGEAVRVAFAEPSSPAASPIALAALPARPPRPLLEDLPVPADPVAENGPAKRTPPIIQALPVVRRKPESRLGHAPDYSWVQGVLAVRTGGELELRYADTAATDPWGGKVILIEGPHLETFQPGDILWIAGELVARSGPAATGAPPPRYRVRSVCVIQPAQSMPEHRQ
jgi:hypothetical protein